MASVFTLRTLLFLLFVLFSIVPAFTTLNCSPALSIEVDNINGTDEADCLLGGVRSCFSLQYVLRFLERNNSGVCARITVIPSNNPYNLSYEEITINGSLTLRSANSLDTVRIECIQSKSDPFRTLDNVTAVLRVKDGADVLFEGLEFYGCQRPIRFQTFPRLTLRDCSFSHFTASALAVLNVWNITIDNCKFMDSFTAAPDVSYRGNAAGLSVEYQNSPYDMGVITITDTLFHRNLAGVPTEYITFGQSESTNLRFDTFNRGLFFARGGGMGLYIQNTTTSVVPTVVLTVENCEFINNTARAVGGGVYIAPFGVDIQHEFTVRNTTFCNNTADELGGGFFIGFPSKFTYPNHITVSLLDCDFIGNKAQTAGGVAITQAYPQGSGNFIQIVNCHFESNSAERNGAAVQFSSHAHLLVFEAANFLYLIENCSFVNNRGDGAFSTEYIHTEFKGQNSFVGNTGVSMEVSASLIVLNGSIRFQDNFVDSLRGGALFINTFGQIHLKRGSKMEFFHNTGRVGAAIVVDVQEYSIPLSDLAGNPQCFLVFEEPRIPPHNWDNVDILFANNTAQVGSVIYASFLNVCSWFSNNISTNIFDIHEFLTWSAFNMTYGLNYNLAHTNKTDEKFYVQTEAIKVHVQESSLKVWPGQEIKVDVSVEDQYGNPTYVILRLIDERVSFLNQTFENDDNGLKEDLIFTASPDLIPLLPVMDTLKFHIAMPEALEERFKQQPNNITTTFLIDAPYNVRNLENSVRLTITLEPCPPGYILEEHASGSHDDFSTDLECTCGLNSSEIIQCSPEDDAVIFQEGLWVGVNSGEEYRVIHLPCPQPHCVCVKGFNPSLVDCVTVFNHRNPDLQCYNNRSGVLCGRCRSGWGVGVLTTHCYDPVPYGYLLFLPLIVYQVVVIVLMVVLGVKIPAILKSLLFYIQVTPYLANFFPSKFWSGKVFLYCFTSLVALYFPWDFSMWPDMPALASYALVYQIWIPMAIVVTVVMAIRTRYRRKFWSGVWSLVLMTSGITLYTSFGLLFCVNLPLDSDAGSTPWKWYYDGNVSCFNGWHIPLGLIAIAVILAYAAFTIALFVFTFRPQLKHTEKFGDFLRAIHRGYREGLEWYGPFELLRRFVLILFIVYLPGVSVFPICVVFVLFLVHMYAAPYVFWWQNLLETANFCILLTMLLFRSVAVTNGVLNIHGSNEVSVALGEDISQANGLAGFLLFWYYLPIAVAIVALAVVFIYRLWHGPFGKKLKAKKDLATPQGELNETTQEPTTTDLGLHDSGVKLVTFSVLEADDGPNEIEPK